MRFMQYALSAGLCCLLASVASAKESAEARALPVNAFVGEITELPDFRGKDDPALKDAHLYDTEWGLILTDNPEDAAKAARELRAAAAEFYRYFGQRLRRGLIYDHRYEQAVKDRSFDGVMWRFPWRFHRLSSGADKQPDAIAQALRARLKAQFEKAGVRKSDAEIDALLKARAMQKGSGRVKSGLPSIQLEKASPMTGKIQVKLMRHEIGHLVFMKEVIGKPSGEGYGSAAPDWLDEAAAIMMEDAALTARRRKAFRGMVKNGRLYRLQDYFSMEHPTRHMQVLKGLRDKVKKGGTITVAFKLEPGSKMLQPLDDFYAFTRGFIDYLVEKSGNPRIFRHLARAAGEGMTAAEWFARHGTDYGLPGDMKALDADFRAYARALVQ